MSEYNYNEKVKSIFQVNSRCCFFLSGEKILPPNKNAPLIMHKKQPFFRLHFKIGLKKSKKIFFESRISVLSVL